MQMVCVAMHAFIKHVLQVQPAGNTNLTSKHVINMCKSTSQSQFDSK